MRLIKVLAVLILAALIGLAGYAYFGDMEPVRREVRSPLSTGTGTGAAATVPADEAAGAGASDAETAEAETTQAETADAEAAGTAPDAGDAAGE